MKANELMVGDWVCYNAPNKYYTKVEEIRCKDKGEIYYIRGYRDSEDPSSERLVFGDFNMDILHPIPLTPEILEKNGFVKASMVSDTPSYDKDEEGNMHFSLNEKFWGWWQPNNTFLIPANGLGWIELKYVHELQHALRLGNIEKEIVL